MACRLFTTKPLSKPVITYYQLDSKDHNAIQYSKFKFSFTKIYLKISSAKWRPFGLGLNVLIISTWCKKGVCFRKWMMIIHRGHVWQNKSFSSISKSRAFLFWMRLNENARWKQQKSINSFHQLFIGKNEVNYCSRTQLKWLQCLTYFR